MDRSFKFGKLGNVFRKFGLLMVIIIMVLIMCIISPTFRTSQNIVNILRQVSINGILAVGLTFVILTGGIDLSVGAIVAVSSVIAGRVMISGHGMAVAVFVGIMAAIAIGLFNGALISLGWLPPFIATLASMTISRGFALVFCDGKPM